VEYTPDERTDARRSFSSGLGPPRERYGHGAVGVFWASNLETTDLFENWVVTARWYIAAGMPPRYAMYWARGCCRFLTAMAHAHVASLRGDGVAPDILGMTALVGDESLRRGLKLIAPARKATDTEEQQAQQEAQLKRAEEWMERSLLESVKAGDDARLDTGLATPRSKYCNDIKAEQKLATTPRNRGRPSHTVHTYWVANLRLVLLAQVQSGKSNSAAHGCRLTKLILGFSVEERHAWCVETARMARTG